MPLTDHFQGPLAARRHWTSFHAAWATYLAEDLNERLERGCFAEPLVQFAIHVLDLATDVLEVLVWRDGSEPSLLGSVQFVSPANKGKPAAREAFVSKCAAYLRDGVGVAIIDIVTNCKAHLHSDLFALLSPGHVGQAPQPGLYASAYRAMRHRGSGRLEVWHEPLALGRPLPTLPLWLRDGPCFPLMLEETYQRTAVKMRVVGNGT